MTNFSSVQMNFKDGPQVQNEQPGTPSIRKVDTTEDTSFKSVLKEALPEKPGSTHIKDRQKNEQETRQDKDTELSGDQKDEQSISSSLSQQLSSNIIDNLLESSGLITEQPLQQVLASAEAIAGLVTEQPLQQVSATTEAISNTLKAGSNQNLTQPTISEQDSLSFAAGTKSLNDLQGLAHQHNSTAGKELFSEYSQSSHTDPTQKTITPQLESLINRLQNQINSGAETGTISIQKISSVENSLSLRSQLIQLQDLTPTNRSGNENIGIVGNGERGSFTSLENGVFAPTLRSKQQEMTGLRHDNNQQFFNAKIQPQNTLSENSNSTKNQHGDGLGQQGSGFNQLSSPTNTTESGASFSLLTGATTAPVSNQVITDAQTTVLPSGTLIHDQDVMRQLVDRFQVNRRQIESKIQMKLHPVELGKMEIDLTVKEGSIRANVIAQSQHVQEIIERNINKLKSVLEQQGFNIEDISVTCESEMVGEFDLFDQQLSHNESEYSENSNTTSEDQSSFVIDDFQTSFLDANSGVNVKA